MSKTPRAARKSASPSPPPIDDDQRAWAAVVGLTALLTAVRLFVLFRTPLELYPDEAQYWVWSRHFDFGYFSKPPLIAWLIRLTTLGGDREAFVRLAAPLLHAATALIVYRIARRLYDRPTAYAASVLYSLIPGVQLSAFLISTDAPLMLCASLVLLAYVGFVQAEPGKRGPLAIGLGLALGAGFLAKYAAVYLVIGLVLHAVLSRPARSSWTPASLTLCAAATVLAFSPNLIWNIVHHFATVSHTAGNAGWRPGRFFRPMELAEFFGAQFAVFGPLTMGVLLCGTAILARQKRITAQDGLLLSFCLPPLAIVTAQALIAGANANWAVIAYVPGVILVAAWLLRWKAKGWLTATFVIHAAVLIVFATVLVSTKAADTVGLGNGFKRLRGWSASAQAVLDRVSVESLAPGGLSAVAVDDRFTYNALAYYGRAYFGQKGAAPLRMWLRLGSPQNQAEAEAPLTVDLGRRVLLVSFDGRYRNTMSADFAAVLAPQITRISLDRKRDRRLDLMVGETFRPRPRDPVTGMPPFPNMN